MNNKKKKYLWKINVNNILKFDGDRQLIAYGFYIDL